MRALVDIWEAIEVKEVQAGSHNPQVSSRRKLKGRSSIFELLVLSSEVETIR